MVERSKARSPIGPFDRRAFLKGSVAVGAGLFLPGRVLAAENGILKVRLETTTNQLDPANYRYSYNCWSIGMIYPRLAKYKTGTDTWGWELQDAEELTQLDPTHIRFRLKSGLRWSGGHGEVTAEDVKYSFERVIDPNMHSTVAVDWGPLSHVEVENKLSGVIVFKKPYPAVWMIAFPYGVGHIVCKEAVQANAGGAFFGMKPPPAFCAPYKFKESQPSEVTIFERNDEWTGERAAFDEVRFFEIPDASVADLAFEGRSVDYTAPSPAAMLRYRKEPPSYITAKIFPSLWYMWLGMNSENPSLTDKRVRQAIQYGINVKEICDTAYLGLSPPATGLIPPGVIGYRDKPLIPIEGNPEKARALLAEAGVQNLELTLATASMSPRPNIVQIIQSQLQNIGIKVVLQVMDRGAFQVIGLQSKGDQWKSVQLVLNRFSSLPDPSYFTDWFTSQYIGDWNWERFKSERYDQLDSEGALELDPKKRDAIYKELQDLMEESGCYRFITNEVDTVAWRQSLTPALRPDGLGLFENFKLGTM